MKRGHPSPFALGVEFGQHALRLVEIECLRTGFRLLHCCTLPYPQDICFKGFFTPDIKEGLQKTLQSLLAVYQPKTLRATVGLFSGSVLVRRVPVDPWLEGDELGEQVVWETEQLLTEPPERYVFDFHRQHIDEERREILLVAARKSVVDEYIDIVRTSGLETICLDVDLIALGNAYEFMTDKRSDQPAAVVFLDGTSLRLVVISENVFWYEQTVEMSSSGVGLEKVMMAAAAACGRSSAKPPFSDIVVSGCGSVPETLIHNLSPWGEAIRIASPFEKLKVGMSISRSRIIKDGPSCMICLGLALRGAVEL